MALHAVLTASRKILRVHNSDTPPIVEPGFTTEPIVSFPGFRDDYAVYLLAGNCVYEDELSRSARKDRKTDEINAARLTANKTFFMFAGKKIACDELSRGDIDGVNGVVALTGLLPENWVGAWKTLDNSYINIPDVATWIAFYKAMFAQGNANF